MSSDVAGLAVLEGLLSRVAWYVSSRIPQKLRSRIDVDDVLQEIARTILRTTLHRTSSLSTQDWERMIWVVVQRQLRKQLRIASSPEDEASVQLIENEHWLKNNENPSDTDPYVALDELWGILNKCSERQRRIVRYRLEGLNNSEIGTREGVHEGSVRRQLAKVQEIYRSTRS